MTPTQGSIKRVYCLYRVSTIGQVDKNDIPLQKNSCREFAKHQPGWVIEKEFQEKGVSGFKVSAEDRDAIQELKTAAENGEFDILLVFMFDRIGRIDNETPFVVEWFIKHGISVWSVNEGEQKMDSHVDKLMNYIRFWQANGESQKTSIRVKSRLRQLVEDGVFTGGVAPFGYRLVKSGIINKKGRELMTLEIEPIEAELIKTIFKLSVKEGYGSYVMAEYLNERKIVTHNGSRFQSNTIKRILTNEIYHGFFVRGGVKSKRIEELQIIDDDTFEEAQRILRQRKVNSDEKTQVSLISKSSTLLGGNVYCAHCGKKLTSNSYYNRYQTKDGVFHNGARKYRYMCAGKAMNRCECDGQTVYSAEKVDAIVLEAAYRCFERSKSTPKNAAVEKKYKAIVSEIKKEIKRLEKENNSLERKLKELTEEIASSLLGDSRFTPDVLSMAIENTKIKLNENVSCLAEKRHQLSCKEEEMGKIDYHYDQFRGWADEFDSASPERKKMIICTLFKEINVGRGYEVEILMNGSYEQFVA